MDAAKKKALFRAKLNAQKKEKRIDSPLIRYNESDQPVCKVCNVVLKSEALWDAHQASKKHHEAISTLKAKAAGHSHNNNVKPEPRVESIASRHVHTAELHETKVEPSTELPKRQPSSVLPQDFFDNHEAKRLKTASSLQPKVSEPVVVDKVDALPSHNDGVTNSKNDGGIYTSPEITSPENKQAKGALPEGFFDNKEADLRARGIKPVKPDVKDEYKEFEKLIQEDLQEVDDRLEEEEIDAAEMIEEAESVEQKAYRERVELLKKKKMELMVARSEKPSRDSQVAAKESDCQDVSSDDDSDGDFAVDWRAQHL